jgi:hypothetical protein
VAAGTLVWLACKLGHDVPWLSWRWVVNVAAYVARSRAAQGLGPRITDPLVLNRIAQLLAEPQEAAPNRARRSTEGQRHIKPPGMQGGHEPAAARGP